MGRKNLMRKSTVRMLSLFCVAALMLGSCGQNQAGRSPEGAPPNGEMPQGAPPDGMPQDDFHGGNQSTELVAMEDLERLDTTDMFSDRDMEGTYEEAAAVEIMLNGNTATCDADAVEIKGSTVTITDEGTYILSGNLEKGSIIVDVGNKDKVQLVLKNADITCTSSAAIYVKEADKVFVTLADNTENHLAVTGKFVATDDNNIDGAIFSKADLTLNGTGSLKVDTAGGHGIVSKDDLVITGGDYEVNVSEKGLNANDSIRIADGNFVINAGEDGIHSEHDEDYTKGYVYIENGNYTITAGSDGIHAGGWNVIANGNITITECEEGIEGSGVDIRGGNITLTSADDGINASIPEQFEADADKISCYISIAGGIVNVTAYGDGIDANGNFYVWDGEIYISGPEQNDNGSIDYDGTGQITGGVVVAAGYGGMAQNFGNASTQGAVTLNLSEPQEFGKEVELTDAKGNVLINFLPNTSYNCVTISCPELKVGETYTLIAGEETREFEMTSLIQGGMQGGMPGGQRPEGMPEGAGGGQPPEMPDSQRPEGGQPPELPEGTPPGGAEGVPQMQK